MGNTGATRLRLAGHRRSDGSFFGPLGELRLFGPNLGILSPPRLLTRVFRYTDFPLALEYGSQSLFPLLRLRLVDAPCY